MDKLKELISLCRASITISVNDHKDNYESVSKYMANMVLLDDELIEYIGEDVFAEMIKRDTIVYVIAYPRSWAEAIKYIIMMLKQQLKECLMQ
jgi:hypothetical protein